MSEDICGLCGQPGADKMARWTGNGFYWPGERRSETEYVHGECEDAERSRAQDARIEAALSRLEARRADPLP